MSFPEFIAFHTVHPQVRNLREASLFAVRSPFPVFEEVHFQVRVGVVQRRSVFSGDGYFSENTAGLDIRQSAKFRPRPGTAQADLRA